MLSASSIRNQDHIASSERTSKDDDEDEMDSVENFLLGDSSGGAQLDTCGPQRTQGGSKQASNPTVGKEGAVVLEPG